MINSLKKTPQLDFPPQSLVRIPENEALLTKVVDVKERINGMRKPGDAHSAFSTVYTLAAVNLARRLHDNIGEAVKDLSSLDIEHFGKTGTSSAKLSEYHMNLFDACAATLALRMRPSPSRTWVRNAAVLLLADVSEPKLFELLRSLRQPPEQYVFAIT